MKRRPALVLSPQEYNKDGLALVVPITSKKKGYPFEEKIESEKVRGFTLADQLKA
jgi:mRNA interferase MazF